MHKQRTWLQAVLGTSTATFKIVFFHHPPFSSAQHDELADWMVALSLPCLVLSCLDLSCGVLLELVLFCFRQDWPFKEWGATMVINGHQHAYERIERPSTQLDGHSFTYVVNGLGGHPWVYDTCTCEGEDRSINNCSCLGSGVECSAQEGSKVRYSSAHGIMWAVADESGHALFVFFCWHFLFLSCLVILFVLPCRVVSCRAVPCLVFACLAKNVTKPFSSSF